LSIKKKICGSIFGDEGISIPRHKSKLAPVGEIIPNVYDKVQWQNLRSGGLCDYNNTSSNSITYGKMYNYHAVMDSRNIAPSGWHIATFEEWTILIDNFGGTNGAGGKLKENTIKYWMSPNSGATNESCFTALPGGYRYDYGTFSSLGKMALWWSSSGQSIEISYNRINVRIRGDSGQDGFSVRCVKD
jgi:uncharacterized protein (TIGR02145 family)